MVLDLKVTQVVPDFPALMEFVESVDNVVKPVLLESPESLELVVFPDFKVPLVLLEALEKLVFLEKSELRVHEENRDMLDATVMSDLKVSPVFPDKREFKERKDPLET